MPHDVLISYSSNDKTKADAICNRLESQGIRCWIAPRDVPVGSEYADSIVQAIESSRVVVLLYSKNAEESKQVKREVERAVSEGIPLMPVRIEDTEMSKAFEYYMGSIHWLDAITPPFEAHIDKLALDLKALLGREGPTPTPPVPAPRPPSPTPLWQRPVALIPTGLLVVAAVVFAVSPWDPPTPPPDDGGAEPRVVVDISNQEEARAREALEAQGFVVEVELVESSLPPGLAIGTDPRPGRSLGQGSQVTLQVSGMVTLPRLVGLTAEEARAELEQLRLGSRPFPADRIAVRYEPGGEEGRVLRSTPGAGGKVLLGDTVTLVVSGPQAAIPAVVGSAVAEAVAAVEAADLQAVVVQDWEAGQTRDEVLRVQPASGTQVDRQSEVTLHVVGKGGWAYINQQGLRTGQELDMPTTLNIREAARSGAGFLGAIRQGTPIRVLAQPTGDGWVKIVERGGG